MLHGSRARMSAAVVLCEARLPRQPLVGVAGGGIGEESDDGDAENGLDRLPARRRAPVGVRAVRCGALAAAPTSRGWGCPSPWLDLDDGLDLGKIRREKRRTRSAHCERHRSDGWSCAKPRRPPGTPARRRAGGGQGRSHPLQTRSCATIIRGSTILSSRWRRRRSRRRTSQRCPKQSCPRRRTSRRRQPRRRASRPSPRHQPSAPRNGRGSRVSAPRPAVHSRRGTRRRRAR